MCHGRVSSRHRQECALGRSTLAVPRAQGTLSGLSQELRNRRRLVGPDAGAGANLVPLLRTQPVRVARAGAGWVELVGTDQTQLDVLPVGLRLTAGAIGPAPVQRGARVIVVP
jgi:hypothetical protein